MIGLVDPASLSVTDLILLAGFLAVVIDRLADAKGWSKSSRRLREENLDLARINDEIQRKAIDLSGKMGSAEEHIAELRAEIDILKSRDQVAVLEALERHEEQAAKRYERTAELLVGTNERTAGLLGEIRDALKAT